MYFACYDVWNEVLQTILYYWRRIAVRCRRRIGGFQLHPSTQLWKHYSVCLILLLSSLVLNVSSFVIFKTCHAKIFHIPIPNIIKISFTPTFSSDMQLKSFLFLNFNSHYSSFPFCTDYRLMLIAAFSLFQLAQKNFYDDLSHLGAWVNLYFLINFCSHLL